MGRIIKESTLAGTPTSASGINVGRNADISIRRMMLCDDFVMRARVRVPLGKC
jgi:hypothetical protein